MWTTQTPKTSSPRSSFLMVNRSSEDRQDPLSPDVHINYLLLVYLLAHLRPVGLRALQTLFCMLPFLDLGVGASLPGQPHVYTPSISAALYSADMSTLVFGNVSFNTIDSCASRVSTSFSSVVIRLSFSLNSRPVASLPVASIQNRPTSRPETPAKPPTVLTAAIAESLMAIHPSDRHRR
jgi:hypothetical protein